MKFRAPSYFSFLWRLCFFPEPTPKATLAGGTSTKNEEGIKINEQLRKLSKKN